MSTGAGGETQWGHAAANRRGPTRQTQPILGLEAQQALLHPASKQQACVRCCPRPRRALHVSKCARMHACVCVCVCVCGWMLRQGLALGVVTS